MEVKDLIASSSGLMEKFKAKAPGTYRHCQNIGQLVEPIAKELRLNVENLVVAAVLHDIGKCHNPAYYIENQHEGLDLHKDLEPCVSYQLISRHLSDSVFRLCQMKMPVEIVRMVSQHHGDSIVRTVYSKALEKDNCTKSDYFRYQSIKPTTVDACILMICDVAEATCRALREANKLNDVGDTVEQLISAMIEDQQLDVLTIGHIRTIKRILIVDIDHMFHKRLDYGIEKV